MPHEELLLAAIEPQTISSIIEDDDSEVVVANTPEEALELSEEPKTTEGIFDEFSLFSTLNKFNRNGFKRRRKLNAFNASQESEVTTAQTQSLVQIEWQMLELSRKCYALKRIRLSAYLKELIASYIDVTAEVKQLGLL